jgi:hypothetical protein
MRARLTSAQARLQSLGVGVAASLLASPVEVLKCIFNFFTPTLHCESWAPFARAAVTLLILVGTIITLVLITRSP